MGKKPSTETVKNKRRLSPLIFNWLWLLLTLIISQLLAFKTYPQLLNKLNSTLTPLYFQTNDQKSGYTYYTNLPLNKAAHISKLSENKYLYYNVCNLLHFSQRDSCQGDKFWFGVDVKELGCSDVKDCFAEFVRIPDEIREQKLSIVYTSLGQNSGIEHREKTSLTDPASWELEARWPLFFFFLYFGLKLGQLIREFVLPPVPNADRSRESLEG